MSQAFDVAVLGATGLVGQTMIELLAERGFPIGRLYPLASERSAGTTVTFKGEDIEQETMFLEDPNGNCMEIKTMKNPSKLFKK